MARRGRETLRFGPMKPVGLPDPRTGREPQAVVQLRREDKAGQMWNLVGFQTRLRIPEQQRVFRMIPGLESAEFLRFGSIHRNAYLNSPASLGPALTARDDDRLFFAGQLTGVEGYTESLGTGLLAGINLARRLEGASRGRATANHHARRLVPVPPRRRSAPLPADERELRIAGSVAGQGEERGEEELAGRAGRSTTSIRGWRSTCDDSTRRHEGTRNGVMGGCTPTIDAVLRVLRALRVEPAARCPPSARCSSSSHPR